MNEIKDLSCDWHPAQAEKPHHTAENTPADPGAETLAAFARRLGVNRSTVTRAAQAGRLVLTADGRVEIAASLARWHATRAGREDVAQRHAEARGATIPLAALQNAPLGPVAGLGTAATAPATPAAEGAEGRAHAAALTVHWQNQLLMLELGAATGAQLPREALLAELNGLGAALRGGVPALYRYLLDLDLQDFHPKKRPPHTQAKAELIQVSKTSELRFIDEWTGRELPLPLCPCVALDLYGAYLSWCKFNGEKFPRASNQFLNLVGRLVGWEKDRKRIRPDGIPIPKQASVVIPSPEALQRGGSAMPDTEAEAVWLGDWCAKFADAATEYAKGSSWRA